MAATHWCLNIVCGEAGHGAAVLLRALQPAQGMVIMCELRRTKRLRLLTSGPGRISEALAIDKFHDGLSLCASPLEWQAPQQAAEVARGLRIGISKAADRPWRFALAGSGFLSKPLGQPQRKSPVSK